MRTPIPGAARAVCSGGSSADALMGNYVSEQLAVFLRAIALGAVLGLLYDLLGALRSLGGRVWGGVLDMAFCLTAAASVFLFVMAGDGELRIFIALGVIGGAVLFWCLLGEILRPVWAFWLELALLPVKFVEKFLKKCGRKGKKVFSFWKNWFTIKFTTLRQGRKPHEQEGDEEMNAPARSKKARPPQKKKKAASQTRPSSKLMLFLLAALLVGIGAQIYQMFGQLQNARAEEKAYAQQLAELKETNRQLKEDLDNSESLDLIEDIARDKLGMVKEGEKIFHFSK